MARCGKFEEAIRLYQLSLTKPDLSSLTLAVTLTLACILQKLGNHQAALEALAGLPNEHTTRYYRTFGLYEELGAPRDASAGVSSQFA